ncbi:hypothetical protein DFH09DRAFT_1366118, partial [Mycena vulgaris]
MGGWSNTPTPTHVWNRLLLHREGLLLLCIFSVPLKFIPIWKRSPFSRDTLSHFVDRGRTLCPSAPPGSTRVYLALCTLWYFRLRLRGSSSGVAPDSRDEYRLRGVFIICFPRAFSPYECFILTRSSLLIYFWSAL